MKSKKRLLVFPILLALFIGVLSLNSFAAEIKAENAKIGTAKLSDEGDTIFVRTATFVFNEGEENEEEIVATGYTVGNMSDLDKIDWNTLTPITKENPLKGDYSTKDVYIKGFVPEEDNSNYWYRTTDLYVDGFTCKSVTSVNLVTLNILDGKFTSLGDINATDIYVASSPEFKANNLTAYKSVYLHSVTAEVNKIIASNGNIDIRTRNDSTAVSNITVKTDVISYYSTTIGDGASLTVGGDVSINASLSLHNINSFSVAGGVYASTFTCDDDAAKKETAVCSIKGNVSVSYIAIMRIKSFTIDGNITFPGSSTFEDVAEIKINNVNATGSQVSFVGCKNVTITNELYANSSLDILETKLTANAITTRYGNTTLRNSEITVGKAGNKSTALNVKYFTALNTKLTVNGNAQSSDFVLAGYYPDGSSDCVGDNDVTIKGSLKTTYSSSYSNLNVLYNSKLNVTGDVETCYFVENKGSETNIGKNFTLNGYMNVIGDVLGQKSTLSVGKNLTANYFVLINGESTMNVKGNLYTKGNLQIINQYELYNSETGSNEFGKTEANIGGSVTAVQFNTNYDSTVTIGKDATFSGNFEVINNYSYYDNETGHYINSSKGSTKVTIGGDVSAAACHANCDTELKIDGDATFNGNFEIIGGDVIDPRVTIGGDVYAMSSHINQGSKVAIDGDYISNYDICIIGDNGKAGNTKVSVGGDVASGTTTHINQGADVDVKGDLTANSGLNVCSNNTKLHVGRNVESTTSNGVFEGTTVIDGNLTDSSTYYSTAKNTDYPYGIGVSGSLTVGGDVDTGNMLFDSYSSATHDNITVGGTITGRRVANIEVPDYYTTYYDGSSSYTITNSGYDEADNAIAPFYIRALVPYDTDEVDFTNKDGKAYMAIINDNQGSYKAIDYHEHKYGDYTADNNATCLKNGTETMTCTIEGCGAKETREIANTMLEHSYTTFVETKDPTCTEDGYTINACANGCDKTETTVIPATGHNIETVGKVDATSTTEGYTGDKVCKTCGETVEKGEAIPATGISSVINVPAAAEVNCYQTVSYTVTASDIPEGYELVLYVNGRKVASAEADAEGNAAITTEIAKVTETKNITATIEKDGLVARNDSGDIKAESEITVANGFLAKIVALIKYIIGNIFGSNKAVELVP